MFERKKDTWFKRVEETKVLIADDDPVDQAKLKKALAKEGIDSVLVSCAADAVRMASEDPSIDFVVTDLNMPWDTRGGKDTYYSDKYEAELGGVVVAKELRGVLPVVVYTSTETNELTAYCREGLFHNFIIKDDRVTSEAALRIMAYRADTRTMFFKSQREKYHRDALNYRFAVDTGKVFDEKTIDDVINGYCASKGEKLLPFTKNMFETLEMYDEIIARLNAFRDNRFKNEVVKELHEKLRRQERNKKR